MTEELSLIKNINIEDMIYEIRGKQVMLASDLAQLYKCSNGTKDINKAVKRNIDRFPEDFCFYLTDEESKNIWFQFGTKNYQVETRGGKFKNPRVFTEEGVAMLSGVLNTEKAKLVSVDIMRAFVKMRKFIKENLIENNYINSILLRHDCEIKELQDTFDKMEEKELKNKLFFNGEVFDSYLEIIKILNKAKKEIIIIDNYADETLLEIISKMDKEVTLITSKKLLKDIYINKYNKQYHNLKVIKNNDFHDRFIIIDKEFVYHIGSSINHLGNKIFSINIIEEDIVKEPLINKINMIIKID